MAGNRRAQHPRQRLLPRKGRTRNALPAGQGFHAHQHPQHVPRAGRPAVLLSVAVPALAHQREYPAFRGGQHHPFAGFESAAGRFDRAGDLLRHRPAVGLPNDRGGGYGPLHTAQQGRGDTQLEHQHPADDPLHPLRQLLDRRAGTAARNAAVAVGHHARKGRRRHVPVRRGQFRHGRRMRGRGRGGQLRPARLL